MAKVTALFDSQENAQKALDSLHNANFDDIDIQVIEKESETHGYPQAAPFAGLVPMPPGSGAPLLPVGTGYGFSDVADDDGERTFLIDGVSSGGVLIVVEGNDEALDEVKQIFEEHDGRVTSK